MRMGKGTGTYSGNAATQLFPRRMHAALVESAPGTCCRSFLVVEECNDVKYAP